MPQNVLPYQLHLPKEILYIDCGKTERNKNHVMSSLCIVKNEQADDWMKTIRVNRIDKDAEADLRNM